MPGSGVDESTLEALHTKCGATEYHSSAKIIVNRAKDLSLANNLDSLNVWSVSESKIRKMLNTLKKYDKTRKI